MQISIFLLLSYFASIAFAVNSYLVGGVDWNTGVCATGMRQSPINIETSEVDSNTDTRIIVEGTNISSTTIHYVDDELKVTVGNGKVTYYSGEEQSLWTLLQFHFHAPSEHTINNQSYNLEMHSVFTNDADNNQLLVVGIIFEEDAGLEDQDFFSSLNIGSITTNNSNTPITNVPLEDLYKKISTSQKYNYKGGLTTPLCTESVEWFVVKDIQKINTNQLQAFTNRWEHNATFASGRGNNRAIVPTNRRQVFLTRADDGTEGWMVAAIIFIILAVILAAVLIFLIIREVMLNKTSKKSQESMEIEEVSALKDDEEGKPAPARQATANGELPPIHKK